MDTPGTNETQLSYKYTPKMLERNVVCLIFAIRLCVQLNSLGLMKLQNWH